MDDDGTKFVWDSTLRKFRPNDMAAPQVDAGKQQQATASTVAPAAAGEYTQVPMNTAYVLCMNIAQATMGSVG